MSGRGQRASVLRQRGSAGAEGRAPPPRRLPAPASEPDRAGAAGRARAEAAPPRPALVATAAARDARGAARGPPARRRRVASRGQICHLTLVAADPRGVWRGSPAALAVGREARLRRASCRRALLQPALERAASGRPRRCSAPTSAADRALTALAVARPDGAGPAGRGAEARPRLDRRRGGRCSACSPAGSPGGLPPRIAGALPAGPAAWSAGLRSERGQALPLALGRLLRPDRRRAGAGRDRRRGDGKGTGAARRRPGGDLGGALDARRPAAAAVAADPAERPAEPGPHGEGRLPAAGARRRRWTAARANGSARRGCAVSFPDLALVRAGARRRQRSSPSLEVGAGAARGRSLGGRRSGGAAGALRRRCRRWPAAAATAGRSSTGKGEGMRPDVAAAFDRMAAAASRRRHLPAGQLRLPLRRRTGGALRRPPRPDLGRAAGPLAAPLRDRARPRPRIRLRLARRQRRPLRLRPALLLGALALRLRRRPAALLGSRRRTSARRLGRRRVAGGRRRPAELRPRSLPRAAARAPPLAGTSPRRCSRRS